MYSDELNKQFNAPRGFDTIKLHKGFWAAYKAVDQPLMQEVKKAMLLVKVRQGRVCDAIGGLWSQWYQQLRQQEKAQQQQQQQASPGGMRLRYRAT